MLHFRSMRYFFVYSIAVLFLINVFCLYNYAQYQQKSENSEVNKGEEVNLRCNITDELALSALARAKTTMCRSMITDAACRLADGTFHDTFPDNTCSNFDKILVDLRVGCFKDNIETRVLNDFSYELPETNSRRTCQRNCFRAGFLYYGLEYSRECFCGNSLGNATVVDDVECEKYTCPASSDFCGGYNAVEVFRTGIKEVVLPRKVAFANDTEGVHNVKVLFLLQLNGRNDRQVKSFIRAIYSPRHYYFIHVDKRQKYMLSEMTRLAAKAKNIIVSDSRFSTIWGGASLLEMFLDVVEQSLKNDFVNDWDYVINFSESDFPVLPLKDFESLLNRNYGFSFLASHGYNAGRFLQKQGFDYVFQECEERMWRIGNRGQFPDNLRIDGGSDWVVLHKDLAKFSVSDEELPRKLRKLFKSIILPLESFYHTLSLNSKFCSKVVANNLRLTNWNRKQGCRCASLKKVVDWCGCSPLVFRNDSAAKFAIEKSTAKPFYFARKFDSLINMNAIITAERLSTTTFATNPASEVAAYSNIYMREIDADVKKYDAFFTSFTSMSPLGITAEGKLQRIDVFRENSNSQHKLVFTVEDRGGKSVTHEFSGGTKQYLVERKKRVEIFEPSIDGFSLQDVEFGTRYDYKEEICREFTGIIDEMTTVQIRMIWKHEVPGKDGRTSPQVETLWRNPRDEVVAKANVKAYDSIFGGQFVEFNISNVEQRRFLCGEWSVVIRKPSTTSTAAIVYFPVFCSERDQQGINEYVHLAERYYALVDDCMGNCEQQVWSHFYPSKVADFLS